MASIRKEQAYTIRVVQRDGRSNTLVARATLQIRYVDGTSKMIDICSRSGQTHLNKALDTLGTVLDAGGNV
jgi:hypothetical protein